MQLLTDYQLNNVLKLCINKYVITKRDKKFYNDVMKILPKQNVSMDYQSKYDLSRAIVRNLSEGKSIDYTIESCLSFNTEFEQHRDLLDLLYNDKFDETIQDETHHIIGLKMMHRQFNLGKSLYTTFYENVRDGKGFDTLEDAWKGYSEVVLSLNKVYKDISDLDGDLKTQEYESDKADDYDDEQMKNAYTQQYDKTQKTTTGFHFLDNLLEGGFQKQTLSTFGGNPGAGKTTILLNLSCNGMFCDNYDKKKRKQKKIFIYISLENDKKISFKKWYSLHYNIDSNVMKNILQNETEIHKKFRNELNNRNVVLKFLYKPAKQFSTFDVESYVENIIDEYREKEEDFIICGLYIDYLDKLKASAKSDLTRTEITNICEELRNIAIKFNIPVITATQLNRESMKISSAKELSNTHLNESMGQVRVSDFVACLGVDDNDKSHVFFKVTKNRDGEVGTFLDFAVDFSKSKFIDCSTNFKKFDNIDQLQNLNGILGFDESVCI